MNNTESKEFIKKLLDHSLIQKLKEVSDQGVDVYTHTYDVLDITTKEIENKFGSLDRAYKKINFFSIVIGIILHDISKASLRINDSKISHSKVMLEYPEIIYEEAKKIVLEIEKKSKIIVKNNLLENILHIVASHHGRWGKVQPESNEAKVVHNADVYSAKYHRIIPIGADKILELKKDGLTNKEISRKLNCTSGIIKDRLKRSKQEMMIKTDEELLSYYIKNERVVNGNDFFIKRITETQNLINKVKKHGVEKLILENKMVAMLDDTVIFLKN